ncbi:methionyl-tRNA formyltransferase [Zhihengliuella salsuginis]|uniref:Methionyl-tRNA formyltransferase n=1 Tax=Zhihengliuella salsuginis TaxID=578222 RepID=A0ABQ3GCH2_9MICC|nr:methionyl-tRNA formyltransferase [Zhihengliuella salsuginis]GHD01344.1 methionyl-tRNA formyltransferase [Zhihengliuella salsuginis]
MKVLFAGTPAVAVPSLRRLVADGYDVVAVLTREDAPLGRKRVLTPSPVAAAAAELGLATIKANRITPAAKEAIAAAGADVAAIVAYGGLVPADALAIPEHGWINLHFSLLPAWRGAAPVQHAVIAGDDVTGAVTFQLEAGLDTGPVFGQLTQAVDPSTTSGELLDDLAESGSVLLSQTLAGVDAGRLAPVPQSGDATHAPKLTIDDGRIDFAQPALAIRRRINGVTPEPGAWTTLDGARFKIGPLRRDAWNGASTREATRALAEEHPPLAALEPGRVFIVPGKNPRPFVGTGSHPIELETVQPAGKKMMPATDWARGGAAQEAKFA